MGYSKNWQNFLFHASDPIQSISVDRHLIYVNQAWCSYFGYQWEEVNELDFDRLIDPRDRDRFWQTIQALPSQPQNTTITLSLQTKAGKKIDAVGEIKYFDRSLEDPEIWILWHDLSNGNFIAKEQNLDLLLKNTQAEMQALFAAMTDVVFVIDAEGRYLKIPPINDSLLYKADRDLLGKTMHEVLPSAQADYLLNAIREVLATGITKQIEYNLLIDRRIIWFEGRITPLKDIFSDSTVDRVMCIAKDITTRKETERQLRDSQQFLENVINSTTDPMFVKDAQHRWLLQNKASCQFIGKVQEELLGKSDYDIFPQEQADVFWQVDDLVLNTGQEIVNEELITDSNGNIRVISTKKTPFQDAAGNKFIVGTVRDITDLKQAEAEIIKALNKEKELNQIKSLFVSMVSHEIRTPLTKIMTSADILQNIPCTQIEKQQLFGSIEDAIKKMVQLIEDISFIGLTESGKLELNVNSINLPEFCQNLVNELQLTTGNKHQLVFKSQQQGDRVWLDPKLLWQILNNLLNNAIKYSPNYSIVKLTLTYSDNHVIFEVQDRGIGIPQEDRHLLFECFHRASNVGTIQGTGLGLAIVKSCVERHGGQINLKSEVDIGTTFTVTLPLHRQEKNL